MKGLRGFTAAVVLLVGVSAVAQYRDGDRDRDRDRDYGRGNDRTLADQVIRQSNMVSDELRRSAYDLSRRELEIVDEHLREISRLLRGGGRDGDGRDDDRRPTPRPPDRGDEIVVVRGTMENRAYNLEGTSLEELNGQCLSAYTRNGMGLVDEIQVSVNFGQTQRLTTTGYWRSAQAVCSQILGHVQQVARIRVSHNYRMIISGEAENRGFLLKGNDVRELNQACERFYVSQGLGLVDEISVSVNFQRPVPKTTTGYWRTSFEVCQKILEGTGGGRY